jgi:excisionase family DNA binding protein
LTEQNGCAEAQASGTDGEFFSFEEALDALGLERAELKRMLAAGEIPAYREGQSIVLRREDVEALQDEISDGDLVIVDEERYRRAQAPAQAAALPPAPAAGPAFLAMLRRNLPTIAVVCLLVTGAIAAAILVAPQRYEAEARLMVRLGREYVFRPEAGGADSPRAPSLSEMVNSEVEILSSRELAEEVIRALGVEQLYPEILDVERDPEAATALALPKFRGATSIRPVLESGVIKVVFAHRRPEIAAQAANLLVERFQEKHLEVFGEDRSDALEREWQGRAQQLAEAEQAVADYKDHNGVSDLVAQRSFLFERSLALEQELLAREQELADLAPPATLADSELPLVELPPHLAPGMGEALLRERYELERELRSLEPMYSDQLVREASMRLLDLELQENELLRDYTESNRKVQSVRASIGLVREFLVSAEREASAEEEVERRDRLAVVGALEQEIARLNGEIELLLRYERQAAVLQASEQRRVVESACQDLRRRQAEVQAELLALDGDEQALRRLERQVTVAAAAVEQGRALLDESLLSERFDREKRTNVRVIERAAPPVLPSGLSRTLKLALGLLAGLVAGAGTAVLVDVFRVR